MSRSTGVEKGVGETIVIEVNMTYDVYLKDIKKRETRTKSGRELIHYIHYNITCIEYRRLGYTFLPLLFPYPVDLETQ